MMMMESISPLEREKSIYRNNREGLISIFAIHDIYLKKKIKKQTLWFSFFECCSVQNYVYIFRLFVCVRVCTTCVCVCGLLTWNILMIM